MEHFSDTIKIRKPDDMHIHLREGGLLKLCAAEAAKWFARALVMPNTANPINSAAKLLAYKTEIENAIKSSSKNYDFTPLMSFKLYPDMKASEVEALAKAGAIAGKLYPAGSTTNSQDGIKSWKQIKEALAAMSSLGIVLSIHGEKPDVFVLDREKAYLTEFYEILKNFPKLKIVLEHLSCRESIDAVLNTDENVAGTITVHHLYLTLDDVLGQGINPHNFCKPVVKTPQDRAALQAAAVSGNPKFFFGSDSAPHNKAAKFSQSGAAGIYSAPCAAALLLSFFEKNSSKQAFENFTSVFGAKFYNLPLNNFFITLKRENNTVPAEITVQTANISVVPLFADTKIEWKYFEV